MHDDDFLPSELTEHRDVETGRRVRRFTAGPEHSYPLYYFVPSVTADGRFMVIHRVRNGRVNLWRLDMDGGAIQRLTDGRTDEASWDIWCEPGVSGVYDHLSALNVRTREAWFFDRSGLFGVHLDTLRQRQVWDLGDRICISQNSFSPDGRWFVFVHADRRGYREAVARRHSWDRHQAWRESVPVTVGAIRTDTGQYRTVAELDFHVHHVVFMDNRTFLVNHVRGGMGMWRMDLDGRELGTLRPADAHGAPCHQSVTADGIWYETINPGKEPRTWLGRYDLDAGTWQEFPVPQPGYVHVGHDPAGRLAFYEIAGPPHRLVLVRHPFDAKRRRFEPLLTLPPYPAHAGGQRYHAHPFLGPDRRWVYHTGVLNGVSQVCAVELETDARAG